MRFVGHRLVDPHLVDLQPNTRLASFKTSRYVIGERSYLLSSSLKAVVAYVRYPRM